jgi:hypothetical protein
MKGKGIIIVIILLMSNLATLGILLPSVEQSQRYKEEMVLMAKYTAALQVLADLDHNVLRLYELKKEGEREFTGRKEGPFEIWYYPYYPISGKPAKEAQEAFVKMYNSKMKNMYDKKESQKEVIEKNI